MTSRRPYQLVFQNYETLAMLIFQTNPLGFELFFRENLLFLLFI